MKKHFTILASAILLAASTPYAIEAAGLYSSTVDETPASNFQVKEVNSKLIQQLELNENQYVKLKSLYTQYKKDVLELENATLKEGQLEDLTNTFLAEAAKILTPEQLAGYAGTSKAEAILAESK